MLMLPSMKDTVIERITSDREPYRSKYERVLSYADLEYQPGDPDVWDNVPEETNAKIAQANAFLAYLYNDESRALKAIDILSKIRTDFEKSQEYDMNIRIPGVVIKYVNALDLLQGTTFITNEETEEIKSRIIELIDTFYNIYVKGTMAVVHYPTQNNYNIKTSSTIAYGAIAFPEAEQKEDWQNFAFYELNYILSAESHYIQPDGGVSEGLFYNNFALGSALPVMIAYRNTYDKPITVKRDCSLRNPVPPWDDIVCVDGDDYTFVNPLDSELFLKSIDWSIKLRFPDGDRPPIEDGNLIASSVTSVLSGLLKRSDYAWDTINNAHDPYSVFDEVYFLVYFDDGVSPREPDWSPTQFLPDAGNAVFRSGWDSNAVWFMMNCEHGPVHMTVHDHIDNTAFQLFAYGEYLLIDTGYYKPNPLDNSVTAHAENHSIVLIDGRGPPDKGLLTNFGDTDCYLENTLDTESIDYAEARTNYENTDVLRSSLFVRNRYVIVSDYLSSSIQHEYRFRIHGHGGYDNDGTFTPLSSGGRWERTKAGVDVYVISSAGVPLLEQPPYTMNGSPNVHQFEHDRKVRNHYVLDAKITGDNLSFLSIIYPYAVNPSGVSEMPATVTALTSPANSSAFEIINPDGTKDIAIVNRTGSAITISDGTHTVETDAQFAFAGINDSMGFIARGTFLKVNSQNISLVGSAE
jgi:hypothetical protein